jgi:hypothetical protein
LRSQATADSGWPLQPINEPVPMPPPVVTPAIAPAASPPAANPRSYRAAATEEPWLAPEPGARPRPADGPSLTGLAAELSTRLHPPVTPTPRPEPRAEAPRPEVRPEPPVRASAPPAVPAPELAPPQTDHNLAEMAQQLEAALRRAPMPESRPPVTDPLAITPAKPSDMKTRVEPKFDIAAKAEAKAEPEAPAPRLESKPDAGAAAGKTVYDSLEEEMANLLGRPPGKT